MDGPSGELCLTSGHCVDCRPRWHGGRLEAVGRSCMLASPSLDSGVALTWARQGQHGSALFPLWPASPEPVSCM